MDQDVRLPSVSPADGDSATLRQDSDADGKIPGATVPKAIDHVTGTLNVKVDIENGVDTYLQVGT